MSNKIERESSRNFVIVFLAIVLLIFGGGSLVSYLTTTPPTSSSSTITTCACTTIQPINQSVTVTKIYVISAIGYATAYKYGTCSAGYGIIGGRNTTITTEFISNINSSASQTVTITSTSYPTFSGISSISITTTFINTTITQCPTFA